MLGPMLASIHNLTFYQRLVTRLRTAILTGRFAETAAAVAAVWPRIEEQSAAGE